MNTYVTHAIGIVGATLILVGFIRVNSGRWSNKSLLYELDNLIGAGLLVVYAFILGAYATLVLHIVWVAAAIKGIESIRKRRAKVKNA